MEKIKLMQEFPFSINIKCLHSSLPAKLIMHNCARAEHAKTHKCSNRRILKVQSNGNNGRVARIQRQYIDIYQMFDFKKP